MAWYILEANEMPKKNDPKSGYEPSQAQFETDTGLDLNQVGTRGVQIVSQVIETMHEITRSAEFREMARLRAKALRDEASALAQAKEAERQKWQGVVAEKDAKIAKKDKKIANMAIKITQKDTKIADMAAENSRLREQIAALQSD
ncbi:MAG: hypothetical protein LBP92_03370 [Deltaproteobacteria bacterium]|nr:hypothetical protein [Deltaproteobacteria bacterium]